MNVTLAKNVATESLLDAVRIVVPVRRLVAGRRIRRLREAASHEERDDLLRKWSRQALRALGIQVAATGVESVGPGPYLVVALHEGLVDVPVLIDQLPLDMTFVARAGLDDELPVAGLLQASAQIVINPEAQSSLRAMVRGAAQLVAQGRSIATFPQGSVLGIETAFQTGPLIVATKLELPVLPIALWGTHRAWEHPYSPLVRRGVSVRLHALPPRRLADAASYRELERELKAIALDDADVAPRRFVPDRDGFWDGFNYEIDPDFPDLAQRISSRRAAHPQSRFGM